MVVAVRDMAMMLSYCLDAWFLREDGGRLQRDL